MDDGVANIFPERRPPITAPRWCASQPGRQTARAAADLIADIPAPPAGSYPNTRTVLDAHAAIVSDRMSGRTTSPIAGVLITEHFVIALRAEAAHRNPVADALPW